ARENGDDKARKHHQGYGQYLLQHRPNTVLYRPRHDCSVYPAHRVSAITLLGQPAYPIGYQVLPESSCSCRRIIHNVGSVKDFELTPARKVDMSTGSDIYPPSQQAQTPPPAKKTRNTVALIALITAMVGAVLAGIPGAVISGWIRLRIGFILCMVSLCITNTKRVQ